MKKFSKNSIPGIPGDCYNSPLIEIFALSDVIRTSGASGGSGSDNEDIEVDGTPDTPII